MRWTARPAALTAATTISPAKSASVARPTRPDPAWIVTPAGAPSRAKTRSGPEKKAWVDRAAAPDPCRKTTGAGWASAVGAAITRTACRWTAAPARLRADTTTSPASAAPSGRLARPEAGSIDAPAGPASSAKVSSSPANQAPASIAAAPSPRAKTAAVGAACVPGAAMTRSAKPVSAAPPELAAVTVTGSAARAVPVGMAITPDAGSIVAPPPVTAKRRPRPEKASAAAISTTPSATGRTRSASRARTRGGAWTTLTAGVSAETVPAALVAVARQAIRVPSSASPGTNSTPVAPAIGAPSLSHCSVIAGSPVQSPGSATSGAPTRPAPERLGAVVASGSETAGA